VEMRRNLPFNFLIVDIGLSFNMEVVQKGEFYMPLKCRTVVNKAIIINLIFMCLIEGP
jgi:hypothetical protein